MTEFWLEAECAEVGSIWLTENDVNASNGEYAVYQGPRSNSAPPADIADNRIRFILDNVQSGSYKLFVRMAAAGGASDSYWVRINGGNWVNFNSLLTGSVFTWLEVPGGPTSLPDGFNTIDFAYREGGAQLDKIYLAVDGVVPTVTGPEAENCSNSSRIRIETANSSMNAEEHAVEVNEAETADVPDFDSALPGSRISFPTSEPKMALFPNPVTDRLNVLLESEFTGSLEVLIMDIHGKIVSRTKLNKPSTTLQEVIDVDELSNGTYVLRIVQDKRQLSKLFVKMP